MPHFQKVTLNLVFFLNVLLLFLLLFENKVELPVFLQVAGRTHPLLLHFPIALLFLGIFLDWFIARKQPGNLPLQEAVSVVFNISALFAALTALFGFFLYKEGGYQGEEINWHKWTGMLVALMASLLIWVRGKSRVVYNSTLVASAVVVTLASHLGAQITHGKNFLIEPFTKLQQANIVRIEHPDSAIVFRDVIQPILNEKCSSCHNKNKAKSDLILTDYSSIAKGGKKDDCLVAGNADKSLLYKYALLPMDDSLHMPPKGKQQLDKEEIMLLGWWINNGAKAEEKYVNSPKSDSIHPLIVSLFKPKEGLDLLDIEFADQKIINDLNTPYRTLQQLSATKPYIATFMGSRKNFTQNDLAELMPLKEQIVSIDLGNTNIEDEDLKVLTQFPHLQKIHLQNNSISDEGIRSLSGLTYLETLNLSGTKVSEDVLKALSGWKSLKRIFVYNTQISEEALVALVHAKPSLKVYNTRFNLSDTLYHARLTLPECKIDSTFFSNQAKAEVKLARGNVKYYYTLDGSDPGPQASLYKEPILIKKTGYIKLMSAMQGWEDSPVAIYPLLKIGKKPQQASLETKPDAKHKAKLDSTLLDGKWGSLDRYDGEYVGFSGQNLQMNLSFGSAQELSQVSLSYLEDVDKGVMPPVSIEVWGGTSKSDLKKLSLVKAQEYTPKGKAAKRLLIAHFEKERVSYIKLIARNRGELPKEHRLKKTSKSWLFVDEVSLE